MVSFFDIGNGEKCSHAPDAMLARVTKWKIVHKPLDEYEEIYSHPVLPGWLWKDWCPLISRKWLPGAAVTSAVE
jgi:hypothetical protein